MAPLRCLWYTHAMTTRHPAKYSDAVTVEIARMLRRYVPVGSLVLDPFAGVGGIHVHAPEWDTRGIELEPAWADQHPRTQVGSVLHLPYDAGSVPAVVTSPCYGNRMADTYLGDAKGSKRHTYTTALGYVPGPESAAVLQWGPEYREFHLRAWTAVNDALMVGGVLILNISDHIRARKVQPVTIWHQATLMDLGFQMLEAVAAMTPRNGHGQNGAARVPNEWVIAFRKVPF